MGLVAAQPPGHLTCDVAGAHEALEALADVLQIAPDDAGAADAEAEIARALVMALAIQRASGVARAGRHAIIEGAAAWDLVHRVSERPGLLRDTVVVLLSCESGAGGRLDAGPAGLAGALLSVGAQVVIAPLWLVLLSTAAEVGRAVVDHLARGGSVESLPDAVQAARRALDAAHGSDAIRNAPFVVWCG